MGMFGGMDDCEVEEEDAGGEAKKLFELAFSLKGERKSYCTYRYRSTDVMMLWKSRVNILKLQGSMAQLTHSL